MIDKTHLKVFVCLALIGVLFYWKFLLTSQYSLLTGYEGTNQAYSWYSFIARSIKGGDWPTWDQYAVSGRAFAGEMQTAAFYPVNLLLAAVPFNNRGMLSPSLYHWLYLGAHVLGAYFMFVLARTLGLSVFASLLSGVCFSFGGFMARLGEWPHMLQSGIWLPLICLFTIKALKADCRVTAFSYSVLAGLCLGLSILAGGLHLVIMQAIVVVTVGLAFFFLVAENRGRESRKRSFLVIALVLLFGAMTGAVQLLPSAEHSQLAIRWVAGSGPMGASEKIPYAGLSSGLLANAIFGLAFAAPATQIFSGEYINPYLGVLPLLLAALGIWKRWDSPWVRYCTALSGAAFLYALGPSSLLHGVAYALVPFLWIAPEAGRFMYLADFGLAILAGFGIDRVFRACSDTAVWRLPRRLLGCLAAGSVLALAVPVVYGKADINPWVSLSLLLIVMSCGLVLYILNGHFGLLPHILVVSLALFDLYAFDWSARIRAFEASKGSDHLERLLSFQDAARFLKSKSGDGVFRVQMSTELPPNIGDAFGIQSTSGTGVTLPVNYNQMRGNIDLLNVRYVVRPASAAEPGAVYGDRFWKIYENPEACPRAWLVHEAQVEESPEKLRQRLEAADFDPRNAALLSRPLATALDPADGQAAESVVIRRYEPKSIDLRVKAKGRALLVLSELFYPGWRAKVNGQDAEIVEVDRALRGIAVPDGESRVVVDYAPRSIALGAVFTLASFCALPFAIVCLRRRRRQ